MTTTPTTSARRKSRIWLKLPMSGSTQMPPCGARMPMPKAMASAPVIAEPTIDEAMMRTGSAAANGIAPSEMNEAPSSQAALPFSRSGSENSCGRTVVGEGHRERGHHAGGHDRGHDLQLGAVGCRTGRGEPGGGEGVGDLVDRAAEVEAHHRAEDGAEQDRAGAAQAVEGVGQAVAQGHDRAAEQGDEQAGR